VCIVTACVNYWSNLAEMPHFGINFTKQKFNIATSYVSSIFYVPMLVAKKNQDTPIEQSLILIEHSQSVSHWNKKYWFNFSVLLQWISLNAISDLQKSLDGVHAPKSLKYHA